MFGLMLLLQLLFKLLIQFILYKADFYYPEIIWDELTSFISLYIQRP